MIDEKQESIKKLDLEQSLNKLAHLLDRNPTLIAVHE